MKHDRFVLVKAKGGMGNRMLCAATGILYGQLAGRKIVVDWRDESYSNDGSNAWPRLFSCPGTVSEALLPDGVSVRPAIWQNTLHKTMDAMMAEYDPDKHSSVLIHRKYSVDVRRLDYDEDVLVFWYYTQRMGTLRRHLRATGHELAGLSIPAIIRKVLREQFVLHPTIRQRMEEFKAGHWHRPVIGVHIRYTDRKADLGRYERHLERFLAAEPNAHIFLATDNAQISNDYHSRYKNVFSTPKWFPKDASAMHQNPACQDKVTNAIEALVDMYLLAECDYLIYPSSSTFSWVSHLVSSIPADRVVDIERYDMRVRLKRWIREVVA